MTDESEDYYPITGKLILIVEDEAELRKVVKRIIKLEGYTTLEAEDVESALYILKTEPIDIVLLDLVMPGRSGIDVLHYIDEVDIPVPVIILTGKPSLETAIDAVEKGAFSYLTKPIDREELLKVLDKAVAERWRLIREREQLSEYTFLKMKEDWKEE